MEPYDPGCNPGELGGVGEEGAPSDGAKPLTAATSDQRSQVSLPLPMGEELLPIFMKQLTFIPSSPVKSSEPLGYGCIFVQTK